MAEDRPTLIMRLWRRAPVLTLALVAALAFTAFFAARLTLDTLYWTDPERADVPIQGWMTPRFVAHSWTVPPDLVAATLGLERDGEGRRVTLAKLAKERGVPVDMLITDLETAIAIYRGANE